MPILMTQPMVVCLVVSEDAHWNNGMVVKEGIEGGKDGRRKS